MNLQVGALIFWFKAYSLIKGYWALWVHLNGFFKQDISPNPCRAQNSKAQTLNPEPIRGFRV